jgi:uncharacterized protein (TIGR00730 family)
MQPKTGDPARTTEAVTELRSVCLFCGSASRVAKAHHLAAARLGRMLAEAGIRLVYGGGRIGLMGIAADACLAAGGHVIGVIPAHLDTIELGHRFVNELKIVDSMHERKRIMAELSDAFIILPGGIGTLDEAFETITWRQLKLHDKPVVLVNDAGHWRPLLKLFDHLIATGFADRSILDLFLVVQRIEEVIPALRGMAAPRLPVKSEKL